MARVPRLQTCRGGLTSRDTLYAGVIRKDPGAAAILSGINDS